MDGIWKQILTEEERDEILEMFLGLEKINGQYYASRQDVKEKKPTKVDLPERVTLVRAIDYCQNKTYMKGFDDCTEETRKIIQEHLGINLNFTLKINNHVSKSNHPVSGAKPAGKV